jgi:hypothetical protein
MWYLFPKSPHMSKTFDDRTGKIGRLRLQYRPEHIMVLFVGEAPPAFFIAATAD